jgi:hypothetical protein
VEEDLAAKRCFLIGPIGDEHAAQGSEPREIWEQAIEVMEEIIQPACAAVGLRPQRADQLSQPGEIPEQVFTHLRDDEIVIADLTGANANVMYELGLRHTTPHLTIQLGEVDRLPFDIATIRTIRFKRSPAGFIKARKELSAALLTGLDTGGLPVAATRIWLGASAAVAQQALSGAAPNEEPGYLEKLAEMAEGVKNIIAETTGFTAIMLQINSSVTKATEQMVRINEQKGPPAAKVEIANRLASQLEEPAAKLESTVAGISRSVEQADPGVRYLLATLKESPPSQESEAFHEAVKSASKAVSETIQNAEGLRQKMLESGDATRALRKVNTRLAASIGDYIASAQRVGEWKEL